MKRRIAVVGGGIAGLSVAAALDPQRFDVSVYEGSSRAVQGSALGMWPSARRALARIGVLEAVQAAGWRVTGGALRDLTGRVLARTDRVDLVMVDRTALLGAIDAAVPATVRRVHASVDAPERLDADLVIGADGVGSRVRALVHRPAAERRRTEWVALRGMSRGEPRPEHVGEYWGPGRLFGIVPVRDDGCYWFSTHRSPGSEPLDPRALIDEAIGVFAEAAPAIRQRLHAADDQTLANRLWVVPAMPRYVAGRYLVIGDAAHAMTPNLGRGACEAVVDAVSVAEALNRGKNLFGWQAVRVPATQAARTASGLVMRLALSTRAQPARDAILTALSSRRRD